MPTSTFHHQNPRPMTPNPLLNWMLLSAGLLALLWLPYALSLRGERCFGFNRAYLGLAPLLAAGLPLLPAGWWAWNLAPLPGAGVVGAAQWLPALRLSATGAGAGFGVGGWGGPLVAGYAAGVAWQLARLAWQLAGLARHLRGGAGTRCAGYTLVLGAATGGISSFGSWIFWHESAGLPTVANPLFRHELAHVHRRHTGDRLGLALLQAALWFNPLVYLFARALALTHEFQADADAAGETAGRAAGAAEAADTNWRTATPAGAPVLPYATLLARYAAAQLGVGQGLYLTHSLTHSPLLTRLAMLKNQLPVRRWKQALVLPVLATALFVVGCEQQSASPYDTTSAADNATSAADNATSAADNVTSALDNATSAEMTLLPPPPPAPGPADNPMETPEQSAEYPGGIGLFMTDLQAAIHYPAEAKSQHLQGKVFLGFVVGVDGHIYDVTLRKGLMPTYPVQTADGSSTTVTMQHPQFSAAEQAAAQTLEAEAVRALRSIDKTWVPGRNGGSPVPTSFTLPVQFSL